MSSHLSLSLPSTPHPVGDRVSDGKSNLGAALQKSPLVKGPGLGIGAYPETSGSAAREKTTYLRKDIVSGSSPIVAKRERLAGEKLAATNTFELVGACFGC